MPFDAAAQRLPRPSPPARIAPLATLPVFLDLAGRRAVVVGGSDAAAWKLELVVAAGANVDLFCTEPNAVMRTVLTRDGARITHHARDWQCADLAGAAIAIADMPSKVEAAAFRAAGRAAGAIVNVIDHPEFCDARFGAIVNRSPVVIGISTDGAAPALGQAIRRRIETVLPPTLARWAELARSLRAAVRARLPVAISRRIFWERFAEHAFRATPDVADEKTLFAALSAAAPSAGHVSLVGAGPGDADLLTLKAVRALQSADVILFDDLVSDEVLELARREAKRMLVGKRGGRPSCKQQDITALMISLARRGKRIVRLKSGDPMIFGRAGEEIAALRAAGIAVDVVPGITAALAMAATLGISVTHRDFAHSLRLVTGHGRDGDVPPELDWRGLADPRCTLIFYMAGHTAPLIARRLLEQGLQPNTAVSIVTSVSRPAERRWHLDLAALAHGVGGDWVGEPVIIGIGQAFAASSTPRPDDAHDDRLSGVSPTGQCLAMASG